VRRKKRWECWRCNKGVECLPIIHEALGSITSIAKGKKGGNEVEAEIEENASEYFLP
jgi:hypothetical protein